MIPNRKVIEFPRPRDEHDRMTVRDVAQEILVTLYCHDRWCVNAPPRQIEDALQMLERDGLISISPDWARGGLTALGKAEACALRDVLRRPAPLGRQERNELHREA